MRILLAYIHYPVSGGRYVKDALIRLGHDVKSVGYSTGDQIWGLRVNPKYAHYPDGSLDEVFPEWTPDLVIVMESAWAYHHPVYADTPHVIYGVDNHVRDYTQAGISHYFLAHKATSIMDMTADDVTWLPCGYDPVAFNMVDGLLIDHRIFDVTLIGVMYPERVALLDAMVAKSLEVQAGLGLLYIDYANAYRNSKIALNVSANHDLNQRIFETAAMGCVVLTNRMPDLDNISFDESQIRVYKDHADAIKLAKSIVKSKFTFNEAWLDDHTWDTRVKTVIKWYKETYPKKGE